MTNANVEEVSAGNKLALIWDHLCIEQILARYVPALDSASGEAVADDFTEDGIFDLGPIGVFLGRREIHGFASRETWPADSIAAAAFGLGHVLSPPMIDIDGDRATATCTSQVYVRDGDAYKMTRLTAVRLELVRTPEGWKIERRFNRLIDESGEGIALYRKAIDDTSIDSDA